MTFRAFRYAPTGPERFTGNPCAPPRPFSRGMNPPFPLGLRGQIPGGDKLGLMRAVRWLKVSS